MDERDGVNVGFNRCAELAVTKGPGEPVLRRPAVPDSSPLRAFDFPPQFVLHRVCENAMVAINKAFTGPVVRKALMRRKCKLALLRRKLWESRREPEEPLM